MKSPFIERVLVVICRMVIALALVLPGGMSKSNLVVARDSKSETVESGIPSSWLAHVQETIRKSEYHISWVEKPLISGTPASYQAPNRAQNLRFYFQSDRLKVVRRTEQNPSWVWHMALSGVGRVGALDRLGTPTISASANQVSYQYEQVEQSFDNSEIGLQQTITILSKPMKEQAGRLVINLEAPGTFSAQHSSWGSVQFSLQGEPLMEYGDLNVMDASGRQIPAQLEVLQAVPGSNLDEKTPLPLEVQITVNDAQAQYPLQVNALLSGMDSQADWWMLGDYLELNFGFSMATAGDVNGDGYSDIIIGAPGYDYDLPDRGYVEVYHGSQVGPNWETANKVYYGNASDTWFGYSVATAGDINGDGYSDVIIGAPLWDSGVFTDGGKAYVYKGSPTGLENNPHWTLQSDRTNDYLGWSVATAGDLNGDGYSDVVVGAPKYDVGEATDMGRVYVQYGSAGGLAAGYAQYWNGYCVLGQFGFSVATAGDVDGDSKSELVVGEPYGELAGDTDDGVAYLFEDTSETYELMFVGASSGGLLGWSVSTAGDVNGDGYADVLIGAPHADENPGVLTAEGKAYLYYGGEEMNNEMDWYALGDDYQGKLGYSVATAGDVNGDGYADIIIGQPFFDNHEARPDEGRAMIWLGGPRLGSDYGPAYADWIASGSCANCQFGTSVAPAGDINDDGWSDVLVGAPYKSTNFDHEGMAYLYYGSWSDLGSDPNWYNAIDNAPDDPNVFFGAAVASAGDVNGDGYADIIVGAPNYDSTYTDEGAVYVFHGSANGPSWTPDFFMRSGKADARLGWAVSSAGDINGDGYSDIIVGAPDFDNTQDMEGMVFVLYGGIGGLGSNVYDPLTGADWYAQSDWAVSKLGYSVASAGDVNGDGFGDIVVGAPEYDKNGLIKPGSVLVWHGSAGGLGAKGTMNNADWLIIGPYNNGYLGKSVAGAGDVNADGYSDVIAGATEHVKGWYGSQQGLHRTNQDWIIWGSDYGLGQSVSSAGDINGDGYSDVVLGAPYYDGVTYNDGAVFAYCGSASGLAGYGNTVPGYACWYDFGNQQNANLGFSVSGAGDVNGDGYADIIAGAPFWANPTANEGQARVYYGDDGGPILFSYGDWRVEGGVAGNLGFAVSSAGDVNGDAFADVLIGSPSYDNNGGKAVLFYGNGAAGRVYLLKQLTPVGSKPLHLLGAVRGYNHFWMRINAFNPSGRSLYKLQIQVRNLGVVFDKNFITDGTWRDTFISGSTQDSQGLNILKGNSYHWRMRIQYSPVTSPFILHSRSLHIPWNGWNEADLRKPVVFVFLPLMLR